MIKQYFSMSISSSHKHKFLLAFVLLPLFTLAQSDFNVFDYWPHRPDPTRNLYKQILRTANHQIQSRNAAINRLEGKEAWQERQRQVRSRLRELLIPPFEKTPLKAVVTGRLERQDFVVEKLYFESLPGYPVSAALFIPRQVNGPAPAILFCSGHSDPGFRSEVYQHMIINYVLKGFIVLAFDPVGQGERNQYFREDGQKRFRPTHEHSYVGNQIFLTGYSPAQYFVWDGIRAIDYLVSRPEVDPERIGITGRSGGGTQSAYLMAVDDRIKAAAPECYLTTFEQLLLSGGPQDAEQNIPGLLSEGLDLADLIVARAPSPTLMVTTTRDIFSIQGARDLYNEVREVYQVHDASESFSMVEDDAPHQSTVKNREATYHFFQKFLDNPGVAADVSVEIFSEQDLWVTPEGQLFTHGHQKTLFDLNQDISRKIIDQRNDITTIDRKKLQDLLTSLSGFDRPKAIGRVYSGATREAGFTIEKYLIEVNGGYHIPLIWLRPDQAGTRAVLLLDDQGKSAHTDSSDLAFELVRQGFHVFLPDLSGYGEMKPRFMGDALIDQIPLNIWYAGALTGKYPVAIRAEEIVAVTMFIRENLVASEVRLLALAFETAATDLLSACTLGAGFQAVVLDRPLISVESVLNTKDYQVKYMPSLLPGSILAFDLPDLVIHSGTDHLLISNPQWGDGTPVKDRQYLENLYHQYPGKLQLISDEDKDQVKAAIMNWIKQL
jgi:hypothetical protein